MPHPDAPPLTRAVALRAAGFALAIVLGAVAVWLIVIADSTKSMRIGVLAGIWGALLGAYSMFGARRHGLEADDAARSASDVPMLSAREVASRELAVRSHNEVERIAEAAARRAFEDRLEQLLRRELSREVSDLRSEISRLRQDLLDKVGGQLRLERIETTRVIGSDLEALQHEVRQLKQASETGSLRELGLGSTALRKVVEPARVRPVSRTAAEVEADVQPARSVDGTPGTTAGTPSDDAAVTKVDVAATPVDAGAKDAVPTASMPGVSVPKAAAPATPVTEAPVPATPVSVRPETSTPWSPATSNGTSGNGTSGNGTSRNGVQGAGIFYGRRSSNGTASNGISGNGASGNGASGNGTSRHGAAPSPAETTGPIRPTSPARSAPASDAAPRAAAGHRIVPRDAAASSQPASRPNGTHPSQARQPATPVPPRHPVEPKPVTRATPPSPPPAPAPGRPVAPASSDPFASLPRITPFTDFELDRIDSTDTRPPESPPRHDGASPAARHNDAPQDERAEPVPPAAGLGAALGPAYTGRRRRDGSDGAGPDAGRHSASEPPPPAEVRGGRRRRAEDTEVDDPDLLSRLLARGGAEH